MDIHELSEFWRKEALEWERMYKKSEDQWFDAVRTLAGILGMDPEKSSMAEVVKRVGELMAKGESDE